LEFLVAHWTGWSCATGGWTLNTGHVIGAHARGGRQCTDAVDTGIAADGPARIHTVTRSRGFGQAKGWDGAVCVMLSWAGRM